MMLSDHLLAVVALLTSDAAAPPSGQSAQVALYAMLSALGVAAITGIVTLLKPRFTVAGGTAASARRVSREHEAWERFFLLNDIDPRKIKTGYEHMEAVRRGPTS